MKLVINYKGEKYLAEIKKEKYFYNFAFIRDNGLFIWKEIHGFQSFRCSITCRLKHYKDFKSGVFKDSFSLQKLSLGKKIVFTNTF